jgi:ribosomal-protein-alanine N-acetyltransferase
MPGWWSEASNLPPPGFSCVREKYDSKSVVGMEFVIRTATPNDAPGIVTVATAVWPDEPLDANAIATLIATTARETLVAVQGGAVAGFVDGFVTHARDGDARWEVDLIAVAPGAQGHGVGRGLVQAGMAGARAAGAMRARALIRVGNSASERAFAACGFTSDPWESVLWAVADRDVRTASAGLHVVPVRTFRYTGVWLEDVTAAGLARLPPAAGVGVVAGTVIPLTERDTIRAAERTGLEPAGQFRFWHRAISAAG